MNGLRDKHSLKQALHMTTTDTTAPRTCHWEVDDLQFSGLIWGPETGTPVLMLHGWMDHAESFKELAPLLTGCKVVALDLSGQGQSAHRSPHATYNIWDDLPQIAGILDQLGWESCVLIGHSRGANIAALFAAALPERVRALVSLDSLVAEPTDDNVVTTLRAFILQGQKQKSRAPRLFKTQSDYIARRKAQGNSSQTSAALADRALKQTPDGLQMRGDARLFASSAIKLKQSDIEAVLRALQCPVLNIWATDGIKSKRPKVADMIQIAERLVAEYKTVDLPGDHHFHLDKSTTIDIAKAITDFLNQNKIR